MQSEQSIKINERFFAAIDALIRMGSLQGQKTFATIYGLNWGNFFRLKKEPHREFQLCYLFYLVNDFGVNADWLLTGRGSMFGSTTSE